MKFLPLLTALAALLLCMWLHGAGRNPVLADLAAAAPEVRVDLRYATDDNFFRLRFYKEKRALLRPPTAAKLAAKTLSLA